MTDWMYNVILICSAADRINANKVAEALGYGPDTFRVALPDGRFACQTWARLDFIEQLGALATGEFPGADWSEVGLTAQQAAATLAGLTVSVDTDQDPRHHWSRFL